MKKIINGILSLTFMLSFALPTFASESIEHNLKLDSPNGSFSVLLSLENPISVFSNKSNEISINKTDQFVDITSSISSYDTITLDLSLPENAYIVKKISPETEENIVLIYNEDNYLMGVVDQAYIISETGELTKMDYSIEDNCIIFNSQPMAGTINARIYIQRDWSYYFYNRGYNPETSGTYHDFYMTINRFNFNADIASEFSTFEMSWDAINQTMSTDLSSGDRALWTSNINKMYNQYKCHYNFALQREEVWNLEAYRPDVSYINVCLASCNPE